MHFQTRSLTTIACVLVVVCSLQTVMAQEDCTITKLREIFKTACGPFSVMCAQIEGPIFESLNKACGTMGSLKPGQLDVPKAPV